MNEVTTPTAAEPQKIRIAGMDCGSCAMTIESSMRKLSGVEDVSVSFTTESMEVASDVSAGLSRTECTSS